MKAVGVLLIALHVAAAAAAAAHYLLPPVEPPAPATPARAAGDDPSPEFRRRVEALEARVDELSAALEAARREIGTAREEAKREADALRAESVKQKEQVDAAQMLLAAYGGDPRAAAPGKPPELDALAREVRKSMRQGISQEFKRMSDLILAPTPEAMEARRRQLKMFAVMMGNNAGLDQAQVATFERILNETDDRAREELRPIMAATDDYRKYDYGKIKGVTADVFTNQNASFDREFPPDKSEKLKAQLEPIRNIFGAMLDELQKESAAPAPDK